MDIVIKLYFTIISILLVAIIFCADKASPLIGETEVSKRLDKVTNVLIVIFTAFLFSGLFYYIWSK